MIRSTFRYNIKLIRVTKDFEIYNTYLYKYLYEEGIREINYAFWGHVEN